MLVFCKTNPGKRVYEGRANPNPLTPKEDDDHNRTDRHLKYYIYIDKATYNNLQVFTRSLSILFLMVYICLGS